MNKIESKDKIYSQINFDDLAKKSDSFIDTYLKRDNQNKFDAQAYKALLNGFSPDSDEYFF